MILVVGNMTWDRLIEVERIPAPNQDICIRGSRRFPGGAAANVAATLASLDHDVALFACVGRDRAGQALVKEIASYGVNTSFIRFSHLPTSEFLVVMDQSGNRCFFLDPSQASFQLDPEVVPDETLDAVHSVAFVGCRTGVAKSFIARLQNRRVNVFANIGFWISSSEISGSDVEFLAHLHCVFCNRQEFEMAGCEIRDSLTTAPLSSGPRQLVITAGHHETRVLTSNGYLRVRPFRIDKVENTLGCGDAFMGGYIAASLQGRDAESCCQLGHHCAAKVASLVAERACFPESNLDVPTQT